ncbi:alcohol dehydrogenase [Catellatospora sp. TT07R-123]|uniref:alcohol dehydrogenase catalytic domain-containing protein n=1 Tax=Catellatospora sp. TT07R-123 TaxID=2733863 RepID=UPI001B18E5C8|nr:alcohol dehydrogenase catalytic domain-containing protein [Catellatospora sp. TT07R-123]GHJ44217.1 alcohol dehydrogenase [Catellatospora sp. TT07R-123]
MRAAVITQAKSPWLLREVPTPTAGPGQVLIRVHASGLCHNDLYLSQGVLPLPPLDPVVTGHEPAGEVVEVGPGVTSRKVGDRVGATWVQATCGTCDYCRLGRPLTGQAAMSCRGATLTGLTAPGGQAEYIAVRAESTVLLPDGLSYESAAPVLCAGYTAWSALRAAQPQPGERVAVLGIGGLGHLALQFARASGFETVAVTHSADKHDLARKLGADHVVADGAELRAAGGADVLVVTGASNAAASDALQGVRADGRVAMTTIDPTTPLAIGPMAGMWWKRLRIVGASHDGLDRLAEALKLVASGAVTPMVEAYPCERINEAVDRFERGEVRFRAVVTY